MPRKAGQGPSVLVLHADAADYAARLRTRFPDVCFWPCTLNEAVPALLSAERPRIALTFKIRGSAFPRSALLDHGSVEWLHAGGAGIDHLHQWDPGRITVTNSSGIHGDIMAQYVLCAMLMFNQRIPAYIRQQRAREWLGRLNRTIEGQTLVVVGFGQVGAAVGRLARAIGMRVVGVRASPQSSKAADLVVGLDGLHAALGEADHVALTLPLTLATTGLFDAAAFAALRPNAHLVDVSRGGVVDETALLAALASDRLAGATLDVFATEPLPADSPFWDHPKVLVTPHASSDIEGWQQRVLDLFSDNLRCWLDGRPLRNVVDPARGY
jgi:phosphoglycerate dehydrogenase-like enzyme